MTKPQICILMEDDMSSKGPRWLVKNSNKRQMSVLGRIQPHVHLTSECLLLKSGRKAINCGWCHSYADSITESQEN
jgi:hypothetical protein